MPRKKTRDPAIAPDGRRAEIMRMALMVLPAMVATIGFGGLALRSELQAWDARLHQLAPAGAVAVETRIAAPGRILLPGTPDLDAEFRAAIAGLSQEGSWFALVGADLTLLADSCPPDLPRQPVLPEWLHEQLAAGKMEGGGPWPLGPSIVPVHVQAVPLRNRPELLLHVAQNRPLATLMMPEYSLMLALVVLALAAEGFVLAQCCRRVLPRPAAPPPAPDETLRSMYLHDLRSSLLAAQGLVGFSLRDANLSPASTEGLKAAELALRQMAALLSETTPGQEVVDLRALLRTVAEINRPQREARRNQLVAELGEGPLWVRTRPGAVFRILLNLLDNASKYTSDGIVELFMAISPGSDGQYRITVTVRDNGPGIPLAEQRHVFALHARSAASNPDGMAGEGIGLAVVNQLAGLLDGEILLHSTLGKGTSFRLNFPVTAAEPPADLAPEPLRGYRIWVVDDSRLIGEILARQLRDAGAEPRSFDAAPAVLTTLAAMPAGDLPDVVLTDLRMPGFDPAGFVGALQKAVPAPQAGRRKPLVIAHSAHLSDSLRRLCLEAGYDGVMEKGEALATRIRQILDR